MSDLIEKEIAFDEWWLRNHPFDWFAKERDGEPLPFKDRLLVLDLCRAAYQHDKRKGIDGYEIRSSHRPESK